MSQRITSGIVALYLLGCILIGGSAQNPWTNLGLQVVGIGLIAWAAIAGRTAPGKRALSIHILLAGALLVILLQLIPLPPDIWTKLPGRAAITGGLKALGYSPHAFPISESPYASVLTLFAAIPAIAVFAATERLSPSARYLAAAVVAGLVAAVSLGALQVAGGPGSSYYLYEIHNPGAIGFFANANHMATLLLVGIPMAAVLVISAKSSRRQSTFGRYAIGLSLIVLILLGIILNGSRAALGLSIPVIIASAALFPAAVRWRRAALGLAALTLVAGAAVMITDPIGGTQPSQNQTVTPAGSRSDIWSITGQAIRDNFPVGTGLGTFQTVYHRYERPEQVTASYVNHAHNDYFEVFLELGAAGVLLVLLFLAWWAILAVRIWGSAYSSPFARAATIATGAVLVHSLVDFPLRTGAISAIFGACLALMVQHLRPATAPQPGEARAARHVSLG